MNTSTASLLRCTACLIAILTLTADLQGQQRPPRLIFEGDFETLEHGVGRMGTADLERALGCTRLVETPVRSGRRALEVTLDRGAGDHRTDFYITDIGGRFRTGREYWFGFSVYFPQDWQPDTQNELFAQWVRSTKTPAGPQLALYINGPNYVLRKRWDADPALDERQVEYANLWRNSVLPDRGRWTDWVAHIRWSTTADGFVTMWKNGEVIVRDTGPNCYNDGDDLAPYFKFGIYKWPWRQTADLAPSVVDRRRLFFDDIRIGDSTASLEAVSPPQR